MARKATITACYPVTLKVDGEYVPPGTPVKLPKDEAESLMERFGVRPDEPAAKKPAETETVDDPDGGEGDDDGDDLPDAL